MTDPRTLFSLPESSFGFGCGPLGVHGFGDVDLTECRLAVAMAMDTGVRVFDTSDAYGQGTSETQLALALDQKRSKAIIITKGGIRFGVDQKTYYDSSPIWLEQAMAASLKRLNTDYIDIYQIHYWDGVTPLEASFAWLEAQCKAGRIRSYGISNFDLTSMPESFFREFPNCTTYSKEYSMINQSAVSQCAQMEQFQPNSLFLPTGVLAQGMLSGRYDDRSTFGGNDRRSKSNYVNFRSAAINQSRDLIAVLDALPSSNAAMAIAWIYRNMPKALPLVGIKSRTQLTDALAASTIDLASEFWNQIETVTSQFGPDNG